MQLSNVTFVLQDVVDGYYMIYDGACAITKDITRATVFHLTLDAGGDFNPYPSIPHPFLQDSDHAWVPVKI